MHYLKNPALPSIINKALSIGGTGVHIFFFCSGFGLYASYLKQELNFNQFIRKRFFKVYVPYIFVVGVSALFPYMYKGDSFSAFLSHLFFYKMFIPIYEDSFGYHLWYVSTLFQFYFIFIPLIKFKEKIESSNTFLTICFCVSVFWWIFTSAFGVEDERIWGSFFLQYLWEFSLGIVIADYLHKGHTIELNDRMLLFTFFLGIGVAGWAKLAGSWYTTFNDPFAFLGYGAIAMWMFIKLPLYLIDFIHYISKISYELYLIHVLVFISVNQLINSWLLGVFISLNLSFVIATILNCCIANIKGNVKWQE